MSIQLTATDRLIDIKNDLKNMAKRARKTLAERATRMVETMTKIASDADEGKTNGDLKASYEMMHSYSPLQEAAQKAGELQVLANALAYIEKQEEAGVGAETILRNFLQYVVSVAMQDGSRSESSSNPFSNAIQMFAGNGRGNVYRDLHLMVSHQIEKLS